MSVRAYKIIEIKTNDEPTFNCWHDWDLISSVAYTTDNYDGNGGIIEFEKDSLLEELKDDKWNNEQKEIIKEIINDCDKDDFVQYYCY